MRGRRATKKELDDRPFNYPASKQGEKQTKLKKLWLGEVVESDEGWCSGGTIRSNELFPRDNSRVSEASLSSGVGEEEGLASQKKDVKHVTASNAFDPKLETEGIRIPRNTWENSDNITDGGEDQKIAEFRAESPRCSLSPPPPNPNSPGEVSTYISYYLRRNLAHGKKSNVLQSFRPSVDAFLLVFSQQRSQKHQWRKVMRVAWMDHRMTNTSRQMQSEIQKLIQKQIQIQIQI